MTLDRTSTARWEGDLKGGSGTVALGSGHFSGPYTFASRFESGAETNPEELIAAAHAACFAMAFSNELAKAGHVPESMDVSATVSLDMSDGPTITKVHLVATGVVPGVEQTTFDEIAEAAKNGCPVSKVLNADITLDATLEG